MRKLPRYKWCQGGITSPKGFAASGIKAGIKSDKKDMALLVTESPAILAAAFTQNRIKAAPVLLCQNRLKRHKAVKAVIINSGNANACTGKRGMTDAEAMASLTASLLGTSASAVLVCSTGTIGERLPMGKIRYGIQCAVNNLSRRNGSAAARAIMTTDTCAKQAALRMNIDGKRVTIGAMAKGSGMIAPHMATLLVFISTDAAITQGALQRSLSSAVDISFNRILVDGDQSTNDTVLCLANGMAGNILLSERHKDWRVFNAALQDVCQKLSEMLIRDGEGVTRVIRLAVKGANSSHEAEIVARSIARSLLVKTSWFGADPNWGRVMCAAGYSGVEIKPDKINVYYNGIPAVRNGMSSGLPPEQLHKIIKGKEFSLTVDLRQGKKSYSMLTCDCSIDYVKINADYMT